MARNTRSTVWAEASPLGNQKVVSIPKYDVWRDHSWAFQSMAAYYTTGPAVNLTEGEFAHPLEAERVSADYFRLFGAAPVVGRAFSEEEDRPGRRPVAVIGEKLWRNHFRASQALLVLCAQTTAAPNPATRYYVVFLRPEPARKPLSKADGERIQSAHMANIQKMARDGVLIAAGPFEDTPVTISGIFVFKVDSLESAEAIAAQNTTVVEHRNTVDVHAWLGPEEIGVEYFRLHKLDPKTPENMQAHPLCPVYRGPRREEKRSVRGALLASHERYIDLLREQGKLGAAGGVEASGDMVGLAIFKPISLEDAQGLLGEDPAVQAGVLRVEYHRWWSSDHVLPW
jgi:uncharacterized protein YciI